VIGGGRVTKGELVPGRGAWQGEAGKNRMYRAGEGKKKAVGGGGDLMGGR